MIILDEVKHDLSVLGPEVKDMGDALAIPTNSQRYEELTQRARSRAFSTTLRTAARCLRR